MVFHAAAVLQNSGQSFLMAFMHTEDRAMQGCNPSAVCSFSIKQAFIAKARESVNNSKNLHKGRKPLFLYAENTKR